MRARGTGMVYQKTRNGKTCGPWWIKYYARGKCHRESSKRLGVPGLKSDAERLLKQRLGEVASGQRLIGRERERTKFEDLRALIVADYEFNNRKSIDSVRQSFRALAKRFAGWRACDITFDELASYRDSRRAKPATIRRELSILHRAFKLAKQRGMAEIPEFPRTEVDNARIGFFEPEQWHAVRAQLSGDLRDLGDFMYLTGWRVMEVLTLPWRGIERTSGFIRLPGVMTKNKRARAFPFEGFPKLEALIDRRQRATETAQRKSKRIIPWVFHNSKGEPFFGGDRRPKRSFRRAWRRACDRAAKLAIRKGRLDLATLSSRIPHDFRRTAVRNLERAGVSRGVAMELVGHKTQSVYQRYDIVSESDLFQGAQKLSEFFQTGTISGTAERPKSRKHAK
jgi:integrase